MSALAIWKLTTWKDRYIEHEQPDVAQDEVIAADEARLGIGWRFVRLLTGVFAIGALIAVLMLGVGFIVGSFRDDVVEIDPGTVLVPEPIATTTITDPPTLGPTELPED